MAAMDAMPSERATPDGCGMAGAGDQVLRLITT